MVNSQLTATLYNNSLQLLFDISVAQCTDRKGCIIRELLEVAAVCVVSEVRCVQGEEEGGEDCPLWSPCAADYHLRHTVTKPHILWSAGKVVDGLRSKVAVNFSSFQLPPEQRWLYCIESDGKVKKHDSHSTFSVLQARQ